MIETTLQAIVLAAGKSTRFNTGKSKLLESICGQEMILYPVSMLDQAKIPTTVVVGYQAEEVKKTIRSHYLNKISFVHQQEQKGTGDAVLSTKDMWHAEHILIINGDMPLVTSDIIQQLWQKHNENNATISLVTAHNADPSVTGYGRIIKTDTAIKIVESRDFHGDTHEYCCINAGIYLFKRTFLERYLNMLQSDNGAGEYYLTDLIKIASDQGCRVETISASFDHIRGINTLKELWTAEQIKRSELISYWMEHGVRFFAAQTVHIDVNVSIGVGTMVGCGAHIINGSRVGTHCMIEPFAILNNSIIEDNVTIYSHSVIKDSTVKKGCQIGPFAHIRHHTLIEPQATIGNFVEIKNSTIGTQTKAKHLAYLGDASIGTNVNIGAGTITCNHNGHTKHRTIIHDNAYIGSNNTLIAPITIGKNSFTAGGSVITNDVPEGALAIGRAHQVNKEGYAEKLKQKHDQKKQSLDEFDSTTSFIGALKTNTDILLENI